jgi:hypothetical protein
MTDTKKQRPKVLQLNTFNIEKWGYKLTEDGLPNTNDFTLQEGVPNDKGYYTTFKKINDNKIYVLVKSITNGLYWSVKKTQEERSKSKEQKSKPKSRQKERKKETSPKPKSRQTRKEVKPKFKPIKAKIDPIEQELTDMTTYPNVEEPKLNKDDIKMEREIEEQVDLPKKKYKPYIEPNEPLPDVFPQGHKIRKAHNPELGFEIYAEPEKTTYTHDEIQEEVNKRVLSSQMDIISKGVMIGMAFGGKQPEQPDITPEVVKRTREELEQEIRKPANDEMGNYKLYGFGGGRSSNKAKVEKVKHYMKKLDRHDTNYTQKRDLATTYCIYYKKHNALAHKLERAKLDQIQYDEEQKKIQHIQKQIKKLQHTKCDDSEDCGQDPEILSALKIKMKTYKAHDNTKRMLIILKQQSTYQKKNAIIYKKLFK